MKKLLLLILLIPAICFADPVDIKYNTASQCAPIIVTNSNDELQSTVTASSVTVSIKEGITGTWVDLTLSDACTNAANTWCEEDATKAKGVYRACLATTSVDTKGKLFYAVRGTGIKTRFFSVPVVTYTADEESDKFPSAGTIPNTTTAMLVSDGTGAGQIALTDGKIDTCTAVTNGVTLAATATSAQLVDDIWGEVLTGATHNITNSAGRRLREIYGIVAITGTVNDASATTLSFISSLTSTVNDFYKDQVIVMNGGGTLDGQSRVIAAYNGTTKVITVDEALTSAPENTHSFTILTPHVHPVTQIAAAVWNEDATGHQTQGTFGQAIGDPVADADTIWGLANTNLDATVSSRATPAQVNTEVDTALSDVNLDHLVGTATAIPAIPAGTYIDQMMDNGTAVYDRTTDSLQAIRDKETDIETDTQDIQGRLPTALMGGRIDASVGAMATGVVTSAAVAAGAIGSSESGEYTFTVVSSADCTNSAVLFDTNLTQTQTDHWKDSFATFTTGTLAGQTKAITAFNGTTKCMTVKSPGFSTTPTAGDTGILVNK